MLWSQGLKFPIPNLSGPLVHSVPNQEGVAGGWGSPPSSPLWKVGAGRPDGANTTVRAEFGRRRQGLLHNEACSDQGSPQVFKGQLPVGAKEACTPVRQALPSEAGQ